MKSKKLYWNPTSSEYSRTFHSINRIQGLLEVRIIYQSCTNFVGETRTIGRLIRKSRTHGIGWTIVWKGCERDTSSFTLLLASSRSLCKYGVVKHFETNIAITCINYSTNLWSLLMHFCSSFHSFSRKGKHKNYTTMSQETVYLQALLNRMQCTRRSQEH